MFWRLDVHNQSVRRVSGGWEKESILCMPFSSLLMVASNPWHSSACSYLIRLSPFTLDVLFSMCVSMSPNFLLKEKKKKASLYWMCYNVASTLFCVCGHEILLPFIWGGLVAKLYLTLWDPMDCSLPGSSVRGISQTRILEWAAISFSRVLLFYVLAPRLVGS